MKMRSQILFSILLGATLLVINACGSKSKKSNDDHPKFVPGNVINSPSYGPSGNIINLVPTFTWKAVAGATSYQFGHENTHDSKHWHTYNISSSKAGCGSVNDACSYTPTNYTFHRGVEKVWWVRGKVNGSWKAWSNPIVFTIVRNVGNKVGTPVQISPSGVVSSKNPNFTWMSVSDAKAYKVSYENTDTASGWKEILLTASEASCISVNQNCSIRLSTALPGKKISWWVKAQNSAGAWGVWSAGLAFTIK